MKPNYQSPQINTSDFPYNSDLSSQIKFVLQYAILAPSTHNTQPWLFKIKKSECEVYYDPKLILPEADPKMRNLYISIGCAIENLIIAANYFNIFNSISYGPFKNKLQTATILFKNSPGKVNNYYRELINAIPNRRNARGIFSEDLVPNSSLNSISSKINNYLISGINIYWIKEKDKINKLAVLTASGLKNAYIKSSFRKEMSRWMNNSLTKKEEGIPGYALKMPLLLSFILPILVRWFNIGSFLSKKNYQSLSSAPLVVIITAEKENPEVWLNIGRLAERLFLEFNNIGWQTSVFVAAVEMGFHKEIEEIVNTKQISQLLFAVGKVDSLHKLTPRHKLEKKIIS